MRKDGENAATARDFFLTVVHKGLCTHHLVTPGPAGTLVVNFKDYGAAAGLPALAELLRGDPLPAGWPVRLTTPVPLRSDAAAPVHPAVPKEEGEEHSTTV